MPKRAWLIMVNLLLLLTPIAWSVWEHSAIGPDTVLPSPKEVQWDYSILLDGEVLYPGEITIPPGASLTLHMFNLGEFPILFTLPPTQVYVRIPAHAYRSIPLGKLRKKVQRFNLEMLGKQACFDSTDNVQLGGTIHTSLWPQPEVVYRAAWVYWDQHFIPEKIRLPSGRHCEIFTFSNARTAVHWPLSGPVELQFQPQTIKLNERIRPHQRPARRLMDASPAQGLCDIR